MEELLTGARRLVPFALALGCLALLSACETEAPAATPSASTATPSSPTMTPASPSTSTTPSPTPQSPDELQIAYLYDAELAGADATATAPYQAAELAFDAAANDPALAAPPRLVAFDVRGGEPERLEEIGAVITEDPRFVAVLVAPHVVGQAELVAPLSVPVVSLASRDHVADRPPGAWLRLVPPFEVLGGAAGGWVAPDVDDAALCVSPGQDGSRFASAAALASGASDVQPDVPVSDVGDDVCGAVVWTGDTDEAVGLVASLSRPRPAVVGGPALRDPRFLRDAGPAANGTLAVCGCADVSTSLSLRAQRFVQLFQSEYGLSPGPGAVEAWDGARMLVRALAGVTTPTAVAEALAAVRSFDGLGGRYEIGPDGELSNAQAHVYRYRVGAGRWVTVADPTNASTLGATPVVAPADSVVHP